MKGKILVLAEHKDGVLDNITWELLGKGRALADQWQTPLAVLLVGAELDGMIEKLKASGADIVLTAQDAELKNYNAELYTTVIAQAAQSYNPGLILMGYTYLGMEVGPALSVRLGGTMVSNCIELDAEAETLTAVRPIFGGTLQSKVELSGPAPYVVSIEKGVLPRDPLASKDAGVEAIPVDMHALKLRSRIVEILMAAKGEIDITKAKILVSVGRGIGSPDKIPLLKQLADALGGQLSCSRPVADMGWLPFAHQVGISANTVTPDLYLACGISGASQHVTAMRDSAMIIAINSDPNAPIFRVAHYGIVGDLNEIVPHMIAEANAMK